MEDTRISDMSVSAGRLALALGDRGLVLLDPSALATAFGATMESREGPAR